MCPGPLPEVVMFLFLSLEVSMKRYSYLGSLLAIPVVVVILGAVPGCPSKKVDTAPTDGAKGKTEQVSTKAEPFVVENLDGVIKGRVVYDGTPPEMGDLPGIATHDDKALCLAGPHKEQTWIVGKDKGVANVVVFLEPPAGKFFALDEKQAEKCKKDPEIDQPHCVYEPHVVALFAIYKDKGNKKHDTGNKLMVKNSSEKISHNTQLTVGGNTLDQNINPGTKTGVPYEITYQKDPIDIVCKKHTWMKAKLRAFDHPFFAVTDADGNFEIKNVPAGIELVLKTWHEDGTSREEKLKLTKETDAGTLKIKQK
jgi:hypothetical protein